MAQSIYTRAKDQAQVITAPRRGFNWSWDIPASPGSILAVPKEWGDKWITFCAMGNDAYVLVHSTHIGLTIALTNSGLDNSAPRVVTQELATPFPCPQAMFVQYYFDDQLDRVLAIVGASAGGKLYAAVSSPNALGG